MTCELCALITIETDDLTFTFFLRISNEDDTKVIVRLIQFPVITFQREVRFGFVDFLVAFGSILALFLSFSILSFIEVLLYMIRYAASKICFKQA